MKTAEDFFDEWFEEYFCYAQTEETPYSYVDVKQAFLAGYQKRIGNQVTK